MGASLAKTTAAGWIAAIALALAHCDAPPTECLGECSADEQQQGPHCGHDLFGVASIDCPVDSHGCHYEAKTHCDSNFCDPRSGTCAMPVDCPSASSCDGCVALGSQCSWCPGNGCVRAGSSVDGGCIPATTSAQCKADVACAPCVAVQGQSSCTTNECDCAVVGAFAPSSNNCTSMSTSMSTSLGAPTWCCP